MSKICLNHVYPPSSVQRAVYKDIVLLLQKDKYLSAKQLKAKVSPHLFGVLFIFCVWRWTHFIAASCHCRGRWALNRTASSKEAAWKKWTMEPGTGRSASSAPITIWCASTLWRASTPLTCGVSWRTSAAVWNLMSSFSTAAFGTFRGDWIFHRSCSASQADAAGFHLPYSLERCCVFWLSVSFKPLISSEINAWMDVKYKLVVKHFVIVPEVVPLTGGLDKCELKWQCGSQFHYWSVDRCR